MHYQSHSNGWQIQEKFDSINTQLNSAKEIYSEAAEQDIQAVFSEAEAEALAALEEGDDVSTSFHVYSILGIDFDLNVLSLTLIM